MSAGENTSLLEALRGMTPRELRQVYRQGHPIGLDSLKNADYFGVSLGIPHIIERLFWTTFVKSFRWDSGKDCLVGWNVRLEQTGLDGPVCPVRSTTGALNSFGPFEVVEGSYMNEVGVVLHYGRGADGGFSPLRLLRDPLVSLDSGSGQRLLGRTLVAVGFSIPTPSYFLLERMADGLDVQTRHSVP